MARHCFVLRVRPDSVADYRDAHAAVSADLVAVIASSGWSNYSIFTGDDGLVIGYLEADDFDAARARIGESEARARWDALIGAFFEPGTSMRRLTEAFHLEDQLARVAES